VILNSKEFYCLFDTGAKISVISSGVARKCEGKLENDNKLLKISCANGTPLEILGYCELEIGYKEKNIKNTFFVAVDIIPEVIIGVDILDKLGVKLVSINDIDINPRVCNLEGKFRNDKEIKLGSKT